MKNYELLKTNLNIIYDTLKDSNDIANNIGFDINGKLYQLIYSLVESHIELLQLYYNDNNNWISWYIFDNYFGSKEFEAGYDKNIRKIKSIEDLIWLIEEGNK